MLRGIKDAELRQLVYAVAGFPIINRELASIAIGYNVSDSLWQSFSALSFVRRSSDGFELHDVVQRFISEAAAHEAPQSTRDKNRRAAAYWSQRGNEELSIYHLALSDADHAIREAREFIRRAFNRGDTLPTQALIARVEAAGRVVPRMRSIGSLLQAVRASVRGDWRVAAAEALHVDIEHLDFDVFAPSRLLACEAMRYQGNLAGAAQMASEGLAHESRSAGENLAVAHDTRCELRMQLVELDGLRGLQSRALESLAILDRELRSSTTSVYLQAALRFQREHLARWRGDWSVALEELKDCLLLLKEAADVDPFLIARLQYGIGRVLTYSGWFTSAWAILGRAEERFREIGRQQYVGEALVGKAIVARECGWWEKSSQLLRDAKMVFSEGQSVLYESWVHANELRLAAAVHPSNINVEEALSFAAECARIEYRHGQGHALFTADVYDGFILERAHDCFEAANMRYEALEALVYSRLTKNEIVADLAFRALSAGDYWTAARAVGGAEEWLHFDRMSGPQHSFFAPSAIVEVIMGRPVTGLSTERAKIAAYLVEEMNAYTGVNSP